MARNRVIYQSEALYVSKNINSTVTGEHAQLRRVQSANYNFSIERQDVNQFGQLARIDALVLKSPTVSLDFTYYPTDGFNENLLGFYVQTGNMESANFASGQMAGSSGQNFYIVTAEEGADLNTLGGLSPLSGKSAIAIGNGFLSNYTFDASVGNLPTVSVTIEGLNVKSSSIAGTTGVNGGRVTGNFVSSPVISPILGTELGYTGRLGNPEEGTGYAGGGAIVSAIRPGDITLSFDDYTGTLATGAPISRLDGNDAINIQSASLQLPLSRTPIERLGSKFAFARVVDFPVISSLNVSAIVNEVQAKSLAAMLNDNTKRTITLSIKDPAKSDGTLAMKFTIKGSQLQSESFSSSIGANKTVDLVFQTQVGGPSDTSAGIYFSGTYSDPDGYGRGWGY